MIRSARTDLRSAIRDSAARVGLGSVLPRGRYLKSTRECGRCRPIEVHALEPGVSNLLSLESDHLHRLLVKGRQR